MQVRDDRTPAVPRLRRVVTEEDAVREALARAIDEGRDDEAAALLERLHRLTGRAR